MDDRFYERIRALIVAEQERQNGQFIDIELDPYIEKLFDKAEFVATCDRHRCFGFVAYYAYDESSRNVFISLVLVAPEARGTGLAKAMIGFVQAVGKQRGFATCTLAVKKNNQNALNVYRKLGFRIQEERENTYWLVCSMISESDPDSRGKSQTLENQPDSSMQPPA